MKKNMMMRVASALLVAVLLSTCAISGTFAKYTTSDSDFESARVAKWGVTITLEVDNTAFNTTYANDGEQEKDSSANVIANTVASKNATDTVLAPGTAGKLKIYDVEPKTAAMLMAIVADKTQLPLNELRFTYIKEIK